MLAEWTLIECQRNDFIYSCLFEGHSFVAWYPKGRCKRYTLPLLLYRLNGGN